MLGTLRSHSYLNDHPDISVMDRWNVVNWIREVMAEYKCTRIAFHASVQYFDILLTNESFSKESLQLMGAVAIFVGLKAYVYNC